MSEFSNFSYALAFVNQRFFLANQNGLYSAADGLHWNTLLASINLPLPVTALAFSPAFTTDGTLFAATQGGILRSYDGGQTWVMIDLQISNLVISALQLSPDFLTDGLLFASTTDQGVFRLFEHGNRFQRWNYGLTDWRTYCLCVGSTPTTLLIGTETGIYESRNVGWCWNPLPFPVENSPILSIAVISAGTIFAGTECEGLWYSDSSGQRWQQIGAIAEPINQLYYHTDGLLLATPRQIVFLNSAQQIKILYETQSAAITQVVSGPECLCIAFADGCTHIIADEIERYAQY